MLSEILQRSGASIVWASVKTQRWRGEEPEPEQQQQQTESDDGGRVTRPTSLSPRFLRFTFIFTSFSVMFDSFLLLPAENPSDS